jgi:hypothetical protein
MIQKKVACYDVMCWFFWDATFFVITLQEDTKEQYGEQKLRDFKARYLRSLSEYV